MSADLLLLNDKLFVFGLVSFLLGNTSYSIAFFQFGYSLPLTAVIAVTITFCFIAFFYIKNLKKDFLNLKIPIIAYSLIMALFLISSLNIYLQTKQPLSFLIPLGTLLFVFSDLLLAYFQFIKRFKYDRIFIHFLYYSAQMLIVLGALSILR